MMYPRIMDMPPPSWCEVKMRARHPKKLAADVALLSWPVPPLCTSDHQNSQAAIQDAAEACMLLHLKILDNLGEASGCENNIV